MNSIYDYQLYIFDLDGTIVDSEHWHYKAYYLALEQDNICDSVPWFSWDIYQKYAHSVDPLTLRDYITMHCSIDFAELYAKKEKYFRQFCKEGKIKFMRGFEKFLRELFLRNKDVCVATNSRKIRANAVKDSLPLLKQIGLWFTYDDCTNKKPHCEMILKAVNTFGYSFEDIIAFDDSYVGYTALKQFSFDKVMICDPEYQYYKDMNDAQRVPDYTQIGSLRFVTNKTDHSFYDLYISQLEAVKEDIERIANQLTPLVLDCKGSIFFLGIGKSGNVCQKAVSNLRSYGVHAHHININELFHGDFGIIHKNDLIVYLSKSGNTIELIHTAEYISKHFKTLQASITNNDGNKLKKFVDFNFVLGKNSLTEADHIDMAPTVSSAIMMIALDRLCVEICKRKQITKKQFKRYHPGGNLGKTPTNIDYIVCIASGKGTRLYPWTKYIPKLLLNISNTTVAEHIVEYWKQYCTNFVFVVHSEHKHLLNRGYLQNVSNVNCEIVCHDDSDGTASAIMQSIGGQERFIGKNIVFTWSDIYPGEAIKMDTFETSTIFTYGSECRYKYDDCVPKIIQKAADGNIIGIYYFKNFQQMDHQGNEDIVDVIARNMDPDGFWMSECELNCIVDVGDKEKYKREVTKAKRYFDCRFFNQIMNYTNENGENGIMKESIHPKGDAIIRREMNWYRFTDQFDFVPKVFEFGKTHYVMEKCKGIPLYKHFWKQPFGEQKRLLTKIIHQLLELHKDTISVDRGTVLRDMEIEFRDKIYNRMDNIRPQLAKLESIVEQEGVTSINGVEFDQNWTKIVVNCFARLKWKVLKSGNYHLIHGDCQFSNTLYDLKTDCLTFIDPRGYFGKSFVHGFCGYDFGKIAYALSGYDTYNSEKTLFSLDIESGNITIDIPKDLDEFLKHLSEISDTSLGDLIAMLCINWLGLAEYFSNNPLKCMGAVVYAHYYYYKYLAKNIFDN